jgi:predicted AlkP superfamily pyrophosphatase or phosphodiesterase
MVLKSFARALAALALALALTAFAVASQPVVAAPPKPPLILISLDGFRADYLQRGLSPTLSALAADGVTSKGMRPAFPSLTFPNHYTLVTGLTPDHHGVVNNTMLDPWIPGMVFTLGDRAVISDPRWWNDATPLWITAERQGIPAATMFWPGSDVAIHGARPSLWRPYDKAYPATSRVDTVLSWLDLPAAQRPGFLTLYLEEVDTQGHAHGPDSPEVDRAIGEVDSAIGRLVAGLKARGLYDRTNLVIVADHGMAAVGAGHIVYLDSLAPLDSFRMISGGAVAGVEPLPGRTAAVETALLGAHPHAACWRKAEIPARLHYGTHRRVPPIVCLAEIGWTLALHSSRAPPAGQHGYDPAEPAMAALFIAHGPAFAQGVVLPAFDNVDVYPLMTTALGLQPEPNDGHLDEVRAALRP